MTGAVDTFRSRVKHCLNDGPPSFWYFSSETISALAEIFLMKAFDAGRAVNHYVLRS